MTALHGSWIIEGGYLFLWGETWRSSNSLKPTQPDDLPASHPYGMTQDELQRELSSHFENLTLDDQQIQWQTQTVTLPSQPVKKRTKPQPLLPLLGDQTIPNTKTVSLSPWLVEGYALPRATAIQVLQELPLGLSTPQTAFVGADLRFWAQVYRWSLDLIARSKFLPGLVTTESGDPLSVWQPLLDSRRDQNRFRFFCQTMPSVCLAYQAESSPQEVLLGYLSAVINTQVQQWSDSNLILGKDNAVATWAQSLSGEDVTLEPDTVQRLSKAIENWTTPVQDYLVHPLTHQLGENPYRLCFCLTPPTDGEMNWGHTDWKLQYALQAVDDADYLIDAETIWQNPVDELDYQGRTIEQPQEVFLKNLGVAARLYNPIEASLEKDLPTHSNLNPIEVYEFIRGRVWQLQNSGFGVILPPGLEQGEEKRLGIKVKANVSPKKSERLGLKSLLNYKLELAVGDKRLSKAEFERLLAQKSPLVKVKDEWIALQPADVKAAQEILATSSQETLAVEDAVRLSQGEERVFAKLPIVDFQAEGVLKDLVDTLNSNQELQPVETPKEFRGELRPYQARGVGWLAFLEKWSLGACLADDMGLGKTIQLIAFLLTLKSEAILRNPVLLVCPTSVLTNWEREVKRFAPTLSALVHHGDKRKKGKSFAKAVEKKDLVITSYPLVYRDLDTLKAVDWQGIVLDEAQNIKNPQAKQSQAVRQFNPGFRIALTGTPVENRLSELWSILDFLNPNYLGNRQFFQRRFAVPIEKYGDRDSLQTLRSLVQPFILRRLKTDKDIIQDLPEKQEMSVFCGLSSEQAALYQQLVEDSLKEIEDSEGIKRRGLVLTLLLRLKQVCNHPAQYLKEKSLESARRSGKLLRLVEMLEEVIEERDRALIFTQFAEWGKLLQPYLEEKLGVGTLFLYGSTSKKQREEMIDRFQNDPDAPPILILSLKAGGTGLNLTRANHVFHVDRWWNPAVENQATDRAFRIGQTRNVQVHKFVCTGTLEERIHEMIESKKQLAEQAVDAGEQWVTELDTDQLRNLLLLDREAIMED
jgi:SNF2 family DNA or RNA helicase